MLSHIICSNNDDDEKDDEDDDNDTDENVFVVVVKSRWSSVDASFKTYLRAIFILKTMMTVHDNDDNNDDEDDEDDNDENGFCENEIVIGWRLFRLDSQPSTGINIGTHDDDDDE